jgi:hypothetical protein
MTQDEATALENQQKLLINGIEADIANALHKLAQMRVNATPDFEAFYDGKLVEKSADAAAKLEKRLALAKAAADTLHRNLRAAQDSAPFPRPRTGK